MNFVELEKFQLFVDRIKDQRASRDLTAQEQNITSLSFQQSRNRISHVQNMCSYCHLCFIIKDQRSSRDLTAQEQIFTSLSFQQSRFRTYYMKNRCCFQHPNAACGGRRVTFNASLVTSGSLNSKHPNFRVRRSVFETENTV